MYVLKTAPAIVENPRIAFYQVPNRHRIRKKEENFTRCHDKMDFRLDHDVNIRSHQASRFTRAKEWRRSCDDSLSTRYVHSLEEEPSEVLDDPLHNAEMI
jgi:hypothetical protein